MNHPRLVPVLLFLLSTAAVAQFTGSTPPYKSPPRIIAIDPQEAKPGEKITVFISPGERPFSIKEPSELQIQIQENVVPAQKLRVDGNQVSAEVLLPSTVPGAEAILISARFSNVTTEPFFYRTGALPSLGRSLVDFLPVVAAFVAVAIMLFTMFSDGFRSWRDRRQTKGKVSKLEKEISQLQERLATLQALQIEAQPQSVEALPPHPGTASTASPKVPDELANACITGDCVLFAGGGLSAQAGYPSWHSLLSQIAQEYAVLEPSAELTNALQETLTDGNHAVVAEMLWEQMPRERLLRIIQSIYQSNTPPPQAYQAISHIGFSSILSTTWDDLIERSISTNTDRSTVIVTPENAEQFTQTYRSAPLYVVKIFGSPLTSNKLIFSRDDFQLSLRDNPSLSKFLTSTVLSKTILFVGAGPDSIANFFTSLGIASEHTNAKHFALLPTPQSSREALQHHILARKYGVQLLHYTPTVQHPQIEEFLSSLSVAIARRRQQTTPKSPHNETLQRVRLRNIGPFNSLDISCNDAWNVFLGNNGCGKSTLLRAIALGLCGGDIQAMQSGQRLLSANAREGSIELTIGGQPYTTELRREGSQVRVFSKQLTPLESGNWVVLGFPALRGVSTQDPRGPSGGDTVPVPTVADLLPLILGSVDHRLDNLKQWVINDNARTQSETGLSPKLRAFFSVLSELNPGINFQFARVDRDSWQVLLQTPNGEIPIDALSQGMSSVFGWVGTLLERMSAIHGADHPQDKPALLLVDEIDAHLHPAWQQSIVPLLQKHFPKLQIIATTHSPLIIAGLTAKEVFIAQRNDDTGIVSIHQPEQDPRGLRADQILTAPFFGLSRTRNREETDRYVELASRQFDRTPEEEAEYQRLRGILMSSSDAETETEKRIELAIKKAFSEISGGVNENLSPEAEVEIRRRLDRIFSRRKEKS